MCLLVFDHLPLANRQHLFWVLSCCAHADAGGIEQGSVTLQPCVEYVDNWVTVSEQEIADAIVSLLHHHSKLVEGAAGCAVAACRQLGDQLHQKRVAVVCCGGNIALPVLQGILNIGNIGRVW